MKKISKPALKLSADTKRARVLGGVLVFAVILYFWMRPESPSSGQPASVPAPVAAPGVRTPIGAAASLTLVRRRF